MRLSGAYPRLCPSALAGRAKALMPGPSHGGSDVIGARLRRRPVFKATDPFVPQLSPEQREQM